MQPFSYGGNASQGYVTLLACTPCGINSPRLLVWGIGRNPKEMGAR